MKMCDLPSKTTFTIAIQLQNINRSPLEIAGAFQICIISLQKNLNPLGAK